MERPELDRSRPGPVDSTRFYFKPFYIPINVKKIIKATTCSKKIQINMPVNVMLNIKFLEIT